MTVQSCDRTGHCVCRRNNCHVLHRFGSHGDDLCHDSSFHFVIVLLGPTHFLCSFYAVFTQSFAATEKLRTHSISHSAVTCLSTTCLSFTGSPSSSCKSPSPNREPRPIICLFLPNTIWTLLMDHKSGFFFPPSLLHRQHGPLPDSQWRTFISLPYL